MKKKEENKENVEQSELNQNKTETPAAKKTSQEENKNEDTQTENIAEEKEEEIVEPPSDADIIIELTKNVAEFKDKYLRLYSDFENFRRRTAKERIDTIQNASKALIKEVLDVLDDFDRAEKALGETANPSVNELRDGYRLIEHKLFSILEKKGLKNMEKVKGEVFDTELHAAITQFPAPSEDMKNKVIDEIEKGYLLNDKVLRFAKVVVGV